MDNHRRSTKNASTNEASHYEWPRDGGQVNLADVVEARSVGLAFGITDDAARFGNGILARGDCHQLVATLRDAARSYVLTGQEPVTVADDPCPPLDGLWWTFDGARGAWIQTSPTGTRG
jgi:hypothetical protein